jgi:hypothetical protein
MIDNEYMRPEPIKGDSVIAAYAGSSGSKSVEVESERIFSDLASALNSSHSFDEATIRLLFENAVKRVFDDAS